MVQQASRVEAIVPRTAPRQRKRLPAGEQLARQYRRSNRCETVGHSAVYNDVNLNDNDC